MRYSDLAVQAGKPMTANDDKQAPFLEIKAGLVYNLFSYDIILAFFRGIEESLNTINPTMKASSI